MNQGVSVLIAVYNYAIKEILDGLAKQVHELSIPYEILFIDDCSTNQTVSQSNLDYANQFENTHYFILSENIGRAAIRNKLAHKAKYPNLLFIDVDSAIVVENYLQNYLTNAHQAQVLVGGTVYLTNRDSSTSLRYKYGKKREEISAEKRNQNPYDALTLNNLFIAKEVYLKYPLDESLKKYGHEDTKFGYELKQNNVSLLHINNPVEHIGLEHNHIFIKKTEEAIDNFALLVQQGFGHESKLYQSYHKLKQTKLIGLFQATYWCLSVFIDRNLNSKNPSVFLFDLYKLNRFIQQMNQIKDN